MLDFSLRITTPRLTISNFNPTNDAHCTFVYDLNNSPKMLLVNRNMPSAIPDIETARAFIEKGAASVEEKGYGRYLISLRDDGEDEAIKSVEGVPIGIVSMQLARFPGAPTVPDVGFAILAKYYGKGYATEAALGLMKLVFPT